MSKSKKPQPAEQPEGRSPVITIRLGWPREAALSAYITAQEVEPDKTAVILKALDKFLEEKGLWPPKDEK